MFKIIAFDLDGTIADTIPICIEAIKKSVSPYAGRELTEDEILQSFGLNEVGMIKKLLGKKSKPALNSFYFHYKVLHNRVTSVFPGIMELFHFLKQSKIIVALITGKGSTSCNISLKKLGITSIFDEVLYGSDTIPNKKDNILYLLRKYAVSQSEFCYIGDTVQDVKVCRETGILCLSAAWQKAEINPLLEKENPDFIFRRVSQLQNYLYRLQQGICKITGSGSKRLHLN